MSKQVTVSGNTKAIKETLKTRGFKWNPDRQVWTQSVSDTHAEWLLGEKRDETLKSFHWKLKGCQVSVGGTIVYTSPTFAAASASKSGPTRGPYAKDLDYCDAAGNYIGGLRIPGSAPDDLY